MVAEAAFLERVIELHPDADGKPVVIGNCQGGWAMMLVAATRPELFGPMIIAGAPLSYWAGVHGQNPMRYSGGLNGGSWLTALTGDLGHGIFDGAAPGPELREHEPLEHALDQAVQPLRQDRHRGPALSRASRNGGAATSCSMPRRCSGSSTTCSSATSWPRPRSSPATASASTCATSTRRSSASARKGDDITPPQQALGWILDLYGSVDDIRANGQTIVYCVHDKIGHLGIFVSGSVAKKEHQEFASNIDFIDCLPPGLYEAVLTPVGRGHRARRARDRRLCREVRAAHARRHPRLGLQRSRGRAQVRRGGTALGDQSRPLPHFLQPWVRAATTEQSAQLLRRLQLRPGSSSSCSRTRTR